MPRSGVWPADPAEPVPSPTTLFPTDRSMPGHVLTTEATRRATATSAAAAAAASGDKASATAPGAGAAHAGAGLAAPMPTGTATLSTDHAGPGFWDDLPGEEPQATGSAPPADLALPREPGPPGGLDPAAILDAGEAALVAGDYATAALHLGLVVRVSPAIAPAVLAAIGDTPDAGLQMVRGDAYRVLGREVDARRAYEAAMAAAPGSPAAHAVDDLPGPGTPSGEQADDVDLPPFLTGRLWDADGSASLGAERPWAPVHDPDDDSDPFAGEP
jgi:hypothetical protein